jgi:hypothetical protein
MDWNRLHLDPARATTTTTTTIHPRPPSVNHSYITSRCPVPTHATASDRIDPNPSPPSPACHPPHKTSMSSESFPSTYGEATPPWSFPSPGNTPSDHSSHRGLAVVSKDRPPRIKAIASYLAASDYDVVCLQELWIYKDYEIVKKEVESKLPYSRFFHT